MSMLTLDLEDVTLRATVTGTGPTVLLLHAGGENRGVWTPVAEQLSRRGLRTVAYDLRGHGESSGRATTLRAVATDTAEMVRREPGPIVVVGSSLGGLAAITALAEPSVARRVAGLVLVDVVPAADPDRVRSWLDERGLGEHADIVEDILASMPALLATTARLDLPILLVRAGRRTPLSDADVNRLCAANHRVVVTHVPGAGHLVAHDAPTELARIVSAHARPWLATEDVVSSAFDLQRTLGAEQVEHPGGTLFAHLRRVHALAVEWTTAPRTQLAAICHATYGTDGFRHALLSTAERQRLQHSIGPEAEALVYLYGACDRERTYRELGRQQLLVFDRFTGSSRAIHGVELRDFAVLTIVNEIDVARHAGLPASTLTEIRNLVAALASYAPVEAARALASLPAN